MKTLLVDFGLHAMIGIGVCLAWCLFARYRKKNRRLFRFGGASPLSLGARKRWALWYFVGYCFEFITSFWMHPNIYVELACSVYQAVAVAFGMFIVDRLFMLWEPEASWIKFHDKETVVPDGDRRKQPWLLVKLDDLLSGMKKKQSTLKTKESGATCPPENPSQ